MNGYNLLTDNILQAGFFLVWFALSVILSIKMFNSNLKLLVNKIIILAIISSIILSISGIIYRIRILNNANYGYTVIGVLVAISSSISILSFIFVINLRNNILISNKKVLIFTKILIILIALTLVPFTVTEIVVAMSGASTLTTNPTLLAIVFIDNITNVSFQVFVNMLDIISNIYLLVYYNKYYFASTSVMKHLQHQMIFRRNWIYFVICLEVMSFVCIIMSILGIYPLTIVGFLFSLMLLELNTMIDFIKFDVIRNEITIGDQTIYYYDDDKINTNNNEINE